MEDWKEKGFKAEPGTLLDGDKETKWPHWEHWCTFYDEIVHVRIWAQECSLCGTKRIERKPHGSVAELFQ